MSFSFCLYYSDDKRQIVSLPKLLLLDEVDAPLHPSMSRGVMRTIAETIVSSLGVKVIATTHSPSTVAIAPEEALYSMQAGIAGVLKASKASALNILTDGVPTICINFAGRRQVFVESFKDAELYNRLFEILKSTLKTEMSLEFLYTGVRGTGIGAGCDIVGQIVQQLVDSGNNSVFGLIDWDGNNTNTQRVRVFALGRRNGLENVLLDPVVLGAFVLVRFKEKAGDIGLDDVSIPAYLRDIPRWGAVVANAIAVKIFGNSTPEFQSEYMGGSVVKIDSRFATVDDHDYEKLLADKMPYLNSYVQKGSGELVKAVIENVFSHWAELIPRECPTVFEDLLAQQTHV